MKGGVITELLRATYREWSEDKATAFAAALSYYTVFSLAPLLIIAIAISGLAFGREAASGQIFGQISGLVGEQGGAAVQTMVQTASEPKAGVIASIIGVGTLLLGATGLFGQLQDSLNFIWEAQPRKGQGILGLIRWRFLSFGMVLGIGFLLLVSLVVSAGLAAFAEWSQGRLPELVTLLQGINLVISLGVVTLLFAMIYKFLPDVRIAWRDVWIGALVTAGLFAVGKLALELYLSRSNLASAYGSAGSLVILLVWVYYAAQILYFGAEFTQVYARQRGSLKGQEHGRPSAGSSARRNTAHGAGSNPERSSSDTGQSRCDAVRKELRRRHGAR